VFQALDEDRNGVLSPEEMEKAPMLILAKDQDEDDCVTLDEFKPPDTMATPAAAGIQGRERPLASVSTLLVDGAGPLFAARVIRRYDRNRDGKLSLEESGLTPERFRALDTDGDGKLTAEELTALRNQPPDIEAALELEPPAGKRPQVR